MVLKKPYAFLIKYFKIIHIFCMAIITYNAYNFQKIVNFFSNYKSTNVSNILSASNYISIFFIISCLFLISFFVMIFFLMQKKDKPSKYYLLGAIYYFLLLILIISAYNTINDLIDITIDQRTSRALRDIYLISSIPNYYFLIMSFVRGLGFDIKRFNFNKDLVELEIKSEDSEEFEFVLGNDTYKIKRKLRRTLRELKYYILENKFIISIILGILLIIGIGSLLLNKTIINKTYHINDTIITNNFSIKLNNAYITTKDSNNKQIKENTKYVILNASIKSNNNKPLKPEYIYLSLGKHKVSNYKTTLSDSFSDLGLSYKNDKLTPNLTNYIFVFEVSKENYSKSYNLNIFDSITYDKDGKPEYTYKIAKIKPKNIDLKVTETSSEYEDNILLGESIYGNTSIKIKNTSITNKYEYTYENCSNNVCSPYTDIEFPQNNNSLLLIEYDINLDNNFTEEYLLNKIIKVKYKQNDKYIETDVGLRINKNINNIIFIELPNYIVNSNEIFLLINTRNIKNTIKIK